MSFLFLLVACGVNKYDAAIDEVIEVYKEEAKSSAFYDESKLNREFSDVEVYDGDKYVKIGQKISYWYFEKRGDSYVMMLISLLLVMDYLTKCLIIKSN